MRGRVLIIIGFLVLLVGVAVVVAVVLLRPDEEPPAEPGVEIPPVPGEVEATIPADMTQIVVGAQSVVPRGTRLTADAVKLSPWPNDAIPEGAFTDIEEVLNLVARVDIPIDVPVTPDMVSDLQPLESQGSDAALLIPPGKVAYAIAVGGNASVAWAIQPGDHVDVLISMLFNDLDEEFQTVPIYDIGCISPTEDEGCAPGRYGRIEVLPNGWVVNMVPIDLPQPRLVTQMTVQDAIVLRVGSWAGETPVEAEIEGEEGAEVVSRQGEAFSRWVTLIVTPQDALVLKYIEEAGASIDLVLRSAGDRDKGTVTTEVVTLQYLVDRFNVEMPSKVPYSYWPGINYLRPGAAGEVIQDAASQQTESGADGPVIEYSRWHQRNRKEEAGLEMGAIDVGQ